MQDMKRGQSTIEFKSPIRFAPTMFKRILSLLAIAAIVVLPVSLGAAPANISSAKDEIKTYVSSGDYAKELTRVALKASKYLAKQISKPVKEGEKRAIVLDIDETSLSNLSHIQANDYGYIPSVWKSWVNEGQAKAIPPVKVSYDMCIRANVAVFFISFREESERYVTEKNLQETGYDAWAKLYLKPVDYELSAQAFKTGIRKQLEDEGFTILINIGDQDSDLRGGHAKRTYKLPNPFYLVK